MFGCFDELFVCLVFVCYVSCFCIRVIVLFVGNDLLQLLYALITCLVTWVLVAGVVVICLFRVYVLCWWIWCFDCLFVCKFGLLLFCFDFNFDLLVWFEFMFVLGWLFRWNSYFVWVWTCFSFLLCLLVLLILLYLRYCLLCLIVFVDSTAVCLGVWYSCG